MELDGLGIFGKFLLAIFPLLTSALSFLLIWFLGCPCRAREIRIIKNSKFKSKTLKNQKNFLLGKKKQKFTKCTKKSCVENNWIRDFYTRSAQPCKKSSKKSLTKKIHYLYTSLDPIKSSKKVTFGVSFKKFI